MYAAALFTTFLIIPGLAQEQCRAVAFQKPRRGYRCVIENYATIPQVPQHLCTHICMQKNCSFINFQHEKSYCQMSFGGCQKVIVDAEVTVTAVSFPPECLPITISSCIQWVPIAEISVDKVIPCDPTSPRYRITRSVFRKDILVGKFHRGCIEVWKNGGSYCKSDGAEVLQLQLVCSANWVAYTPGDPFPAGTVIGGYLGDPFAGTPIIRGLTNERNVYRCGYYSSDTQLGRLELPGRCILWSLYEQCCDVRRQFGSSSSSLKAMYLWASYQIRKIAGCACAGNVFPATDFNETASYQPRHAKRHVRHARAVMHVGIANPWWQRKRSWHSRRMRNPQCYVSSLRPIADMSKMAGITQRDVNCDGNDLDPVSPGHNNCTYRRQCAENRI